jgi:1-acyl-sn-glycerol-3-phosphate acyltransferase
MKQGWWRSLFLGCFPVQRAGGSASLEYPKWLIAGGNSIGIFPEGTRTRNGRLGKFRPGAALLAQETGAPIVPMHFEGLFKMLSPGRLEAQPGPVTVRIGKPIAVPAGLPRLEAARLMRDAVADLSGDPER